MKSIRTKVIFKGLAMTAIALFSFQTIAQEENREPKERPTFAQLLEKMDADKDGKLAKSEVKGKLSKHFDRLDADKDGFISQAEFDSAPRPKREGKKPTRNDGEDCAQTKCSK